MHCNLRPPDAAPVVIHLVYLEEYLRTKVYVGEAIYGSGWSYPFMCYSIFTVSTLFYVVIFTCDSDL